MKKHLFSLLMAAVLLLNLAACGDASQSGGTFGSTEETPSAAETTASPELYEVRFEMNGGTLVSGSLLQQIEAGSGAEAPEVQRDGYLFDGWNESFDAVDKNMVVVAQWIRTYNIVFDPAGGTVSSGTAEQQVAEGALPEAPEVTLDGADFQGWSPEITEASADAQYVAQWSARKLSSEEVYSLISPAVVEITTYDKSGQPYGLGSGFFIDDQGTLVTNYHVIDASTSAEVTLSDGVKCEISAVKDYDEALDLALLQADISGNEFLTIGDEPVTTGETVYALGSSQGLTSTFSDGIVSTASRDMEGVKCIQITAPISQGNSGGPLVNVYGHVVGINSMTITTGQNLNFAIDVHELEQLNHSGSITLAELYDQMYPAGAETVDTDEGFYSETDVAEVEPNGSLLLSDTMEDGVWIAGEVTDQEDLDWFCFTVEDACDIFFEVAPYYKSDSDYLTCGILELTADGVDVKDVLLPNNDGDYEVAHTVTVHFDDPGMYFLMISVNEEYNYDEPAYYVAKATWQ